MLGIYGLKATNMVFITLIQALCQQSFGLTLPQNCVGPCGPHGHKLKSLNRHSRAAGGGGFLVQLGLLIRVEPGKEVKSLTGTNHAEEPERVSQHFSWL